jgi:hypothetical protein
MILELQYSQRTKVLSSYAVVSLSTMYYLRMRIWNKKSVWGFFVKDTQIFKFY